MHKSHSPSLLTHSLTHSTTPHTLSLSLTHSTTPHPPSLTDPNAKKCRARYGLEQSEKWCGPCRYRVPSHTSTMSLCHTSLSPLSLGRRKKKCVRVNEDEDDRAGRANDNVMTRVSVYCVCSVCSPSSPPILLSFVCDTAEACLFACVVTFLPRTTAPG